MSAERLREAARLMRERAQAATPGPWRNHDDGTGFVTCSSAFDVAFMVADHPQSSPALIADAEHIASWHPVVALAVAAWLDIVARRWPVGRSSVTRERACALAVADAYLASVGAVR